MSRMRVLRVGIVAAVLGAVAWVGPSRAQQKIDPMDLSRVQGMLRDAYDSVKKHYHDPQFHGIDWEARYRQFQDQLKTVHSLNEGLLSIAGFLDGLGDSHTYFMPPSRPYRMDYGYRMQLFGDTAFITRVRPGTDAESKVSPGDQVLGLNGFAVNREDFAALEYALNSLSPQPGSRLALRSPAGRDREVLVTAKIRQGKKTLNLTGTDGGGDIWELIREAEGEDHLGRQRYVEIGDVVIWKMPEFFLNESEVDRLFGIARKHKTLILDLRGNPGGTVDTLERMVGNVLDYDFKIADRVGRKQMKPQLAKTRGDHGFTGQ
jgi:C-terminal processing protease CtpA/Prc